MVHDLAGGRRGVMLIATRMHTAHADGESSVQRQPLAALRLHLGEWSGREAPAFADDVVAELGVDQYINRHYTAPGSTPVSLYVGYYASQRQGNTIHSPRNCLPGAGWQPVESGSLLVHAAGRDLQVNRYVVQKDLDRQVVLYWYEGRGRVVANEFVNKAWLMLDAVRLRRTDGGLVRVIAPVVTDVSRATGDAAAFAATLAPHLPVHLP